jgi:AcrR family transcriptional regulator
VALKFRSGANGAPRTRREFLSRAEIVAAAAALLDRDGYDGLNMRAIAAELGVRAAALYRYVESREDLDDMLFDHLMAGCAPRVSGKDWRADLRKIARAWRARLLSKRDLTRIALAGISIGPNLLPLMEVALRTLRRSGLADEDVVEVYQTCTLLVHSFATSEATYRSASARTGAGALRPAPIAPEWAARYPAVAALADKLSGPADFEDRFNFALDALIAGIERRARRA